MRNDRSEFLHGMELFVEGLDALVRQGLGEVLKDSLAGFIRREARAPLMEPYIFCLTPNKDQDTQWKEYGDKGRGFSFGFFPNFFVQPRNVLYGNADKQRVVDAVVAGFIALVRLLDSAGVDVNDSSYVRALALAYFQIAYLQSTRFKEDRWTHEEEWRGVSLVKKNDPDLFVTRSSWCKTIRRAKIQYSQQPLEIVMGPGCKSLEADLCSVFPASVLTRSVCSVTAGIE